MVFVINNIWSMNKNINLTTHNPDWREKFMTFGISNWYLIFTSEKSDLADQITGNAKASLRTATFLQITLTIVYDFYVRQ